MSTVDVVAEALQQQMLRGSLVPGAHLRQDEIAASLGVSKIPVREALQRLAAAGLLRLEPNRGARVPILTAEDAAENYALRRAIEPRLLERAIPRLSIVDLAEAEQALTAEPADAAANWVFHRALYRASGWTRGLAIAEMLHVAVAPYVELYTDLLGGASESASEHVTMLEAAKGGDVHEAVAILLEHLDHAEQALVAILEREEPLDDA